MTRTPVKSSQIVSCGYDADTRILEIEFKNFGAVYQYDDVPSKVYEDFVGASSVGEYFHSNIRRGNFGYRRMP